MGFKERLLGRIRRVRTRPKDPFAICQSVSGAFLDTIQIDPSGIIRIQGWSDNDFDPARAPSIQIDGNPVPFLQLFRFKRPDVVNTQRVEFSYAGLTLEYLIPDSMTGPAHVLELNLDGHSKLSFECGLSFWQPHYRRALNLTEVLHREQIYGWGPPNTQVSAEILDLASNLEGPLLDFGCGRGVLIEELRRLGKEAYGLELDTERIRNCIPPERMEIITLYDGILPSPFKDGMFQSVFCSEVLEHVPDYEAAIKDIARVAKKTAIFTVPDVSGIPLGFRHGTVPWHLLESTHLNFFNQQSLGRALKPYFPKIEFSRVGWSRLNDAGFYGSLVAVCWR